MSVRPEPRFGLLDAVVAFVAGTVVSVVVGQAVIAAGGWNAQEVAGLGGEVGRVAGRYAAGEGFGSNAVPLLALALLQIPVWVGFIGGPWFAVARRGARWREDFRLAVVGSDVALGAAVGVATQLLVLPLLYLPARLLTDDLDLSGPARALTDRASGAGVVVLVFVAVVAAPIAEELFFRGLVLAALERRSGRGVATVGSAFVFALTHFQPLQFPALFVLGVVLAAMVHRFDRIGPAVAAHMAFNATTVVFLLA